MDSSRSHLFQVIRTSLHKLSSEIEHPSDWRPVLLAHLMTRTDEWRKAKLQVLAPSRDDRGEPQTKEDVAVMLAEFRIEAEACIVDRLDMEHVVRYSGDASLVFFPFRLRGNEPACVFDESLDDLVAALPLTAPVLAGQDIDLDAEPEEGLHQEIAEAVDAAEAAKKNAAQADRELEQARTIAEKRRARLAEARQQDADPASIAELESELNDADQTVNELNRRAAKVQSKADNAAARRKRSRASQKRKRMARRNRKIPPFPTQGGKGPSWLQETALKCAQ